VLVANRNCQKFIFTSH